MTRRTMGDRRRSMKLRDAAYQKQGGLCYYCKQPMVYGDPDSPFACTAEHLISYSNGGRATEDNIVAAHRRCNNLAQRAWEWEQKQD